MVLIVKEPDLGTALVCAAVAAMMLYLAGVETKYFGFAVLASAPVLYLLLFRVPWRRARMLAFLNPEADPQGAGFHTIQSLIAVGTGGFLGSATWRAGQKLFYLPEPHTDFIFANIAEELGLIGAAGHRRPLRCPRLSRPARGHPVQRSLCAPSCLWHHGDHPDSGLLQHQRGAALVPTKGIPLPFISSGGTSLFFTLASIGVLLNLTREID